MKRLLFVTALIVVYASPSYSLGFEVTGDNSRPCSEWCSKKVESPTGVRCVGAQLKVGDGWLNITCGGGPAVQGAVRCSCQANKVTVMGNNSRSCIEWCAGVSGKCVGAQLKVGDGWLDITCGGGPAVQGAVRCSCQ